MKTLRKIIFHGFEATFGAVRMVILISGFVNSLMVTQIVALVCYYVNPAVITSLQKSIPRSRQFESSKKSHKISTIGELLIVESVSGDLQTNMNSVGIYRIRTDA